MIEISEGTIVDKDEEAVESKDVVMLDSDDEENIYTDEKGHIVGKVFTCNDKFCLFDIKDKQHTELEKKFTNQLKSVGRIFVVHKDDTGNFLTFEAGTGFMVSKDKIMTAGHVIHIKGKSIVKIYITFKLYPTIEHVMSNYCDLHKIDDYYELEVYGDINSELQEYLTFGDEDNLWSPQQDIAVLTFAKERRPKDLHYLIPGLPLDNSKNYYTIGYPGKFDYKDFKQYTQIECQSTYKKITKQFKNYEHKTISMCEVEYPVENKRLSTHLCPTLPGNSGGVFFDDQTDRFIGIHLGSYKHDNYFLSVTHPLFYVYYKTLVLNEPDSIENQTHLEEYINYFNSKSI